jgi:hypothetical protein
MASSTVDSFSSFRRNSPSVAQVFSNLAYQPFHRLLYLRRQCAAVLEGSTFDSIDQYPAGETSLRPRKLENGAQADAVSRAFVVASGERILAGVKTMDGSWRDLRLYCVDDDCRIAMLQTIEQTCYFAIQLDDPDIGQRELHERPGCSQPRSIITTEIITDPDHHCLHGDSSEGPLLHHVDRICESRDNRFRHTSEILELHPYRFGMGAGIEDNFIVLCQTFLDEDWYSVQISERGHCANLTVREQQTEVFFMSKVDVLRPKRPSDHLLIDPLIGSKDRHPVMVIDPDQNRFSHLAIGNTGEDCDIVRREGGIMLEHLKFDFVTVKITQQICDLRHGEPSH